MSDRGLFITVEGIDGSGTTSVVEDLTDDLDGTTPSSEPTEMWTGRVAREAFEERDVEPLTRFYFFMADRVEHGKWVTEQVENGTTVISDRGPDSTRCYQYYDADLPEPFIEWNLARMTTPDLTLWLDVDVETALTRIDGKDAFENRALQEKVAQRYAYLSEGVNRIHRVDANRPLDVVTGEAKKIITEYL